MGLERIANTATTTLSGSILAAATTINVTSATGFPSFSGSDQSPFRIKIDDEIMFVTGWGGSATEWNVSRAQEGTTAASHADDAEVSLVLTHYALLNHTTGVQYPDLAQNMIMWHEAHYEQMPALTNYQSPVFTLPNVNTAAIVQIFLIQRRVDAEDYYAGQLTCLAVRHGNGTTSVYNGGSENTEVIFNSPAISCTGSGNGFYVGLTNDLGNTTDVACYVTVRSLYSDDAPIPAASS